jgi:hypothetical protein
MDATTALLSLSLLLLAGIYGLYWVEGRPHADAPPPPRVEPPAPPEDLPG